MKEAVDKLTERYTVTDQQSLELYLSYIQTTAIPASARGHWHHILPSAMFPEFRSQIAHPWNLVKLKPLDHWWAHYLLYKAVRCQATAYAWKLMVKASGIEPKDKECLKEYDAALLTVMEDCGRTMRGKVAARDKEGNLHHVSKDDYRLKDGTLEHFATGTVNVKDSSGRCFKVRKDDPRYTSGEFQHVRKGRITTKSADGTIVDTLCSDPKVISGILVPVNRGFVLTVDETGKYRRVSVTDPDYLSGKLAHARLGKGKTPDRITRQCPICKGIVYHKDRFHCSYADTNKRPCRSCSARRRMSKNF